MDRFYSSAVWSPRRQTPLECAQSIVTCLRSIPRLPDYFSNWRIVPEDLAGPDSLLPPPDDVEMLADYVESTALRNDRGEIMQGGGFSPRFMRLYGEHPIRLSPRCGVESRRGNNCLLEFPHPDWAPPETITHDIIRQSLRAVVTAWSADYAYVITHPFYDAQGMSARAARRGERPVGWLTFVSNDVDLDRTALDGLARVDETADGVWIELHGTPAEPLLDDALTVRRALGYSVSP
ncbi:Imm52 family immunity protein [Rhodococcus sp. HNM0569]|uniref:Imm52 family immunity protein n=1 Tax=Rhodococcus sp. HNM0569 TaxID=2716340 RepID=UPI00146AE74E|nr:Imm52 family immunity protein [Rhodococcus sp. HNM0569]NLU84337.1 hypothetical protein [Rhodococcus sp. HNM0569]